MPGPAPPPWMAEDPLVPTRLLSISHDLPKRQSASLEARDPDHLVQELLPPGEIEVGTSRLSHQEDPIAPLVEVRDMDDVVRTHLEAVRGFFSS